MKRRSSFTDQSVTYGAIGATLAPDLLRYPPTGYRPAEDSVKIGSGRERFDKAAEELMTWAVQRGAGFEVTDVSSGTGTQYTGVVYDPEGAPVSSAEPHTEQRFAADGTPYIAAGMTATLRRGKRDTPVLVVYVVDEPERIGFAYGTTAAGDESGEESFLLELRDDDSVWFTIRSVLQTAGGARAVLAPSIRRRRRELTQRELRALHPAFL